MDGAAADNAKSPSPFPVLGGPAAAERGDFPLPFAASRL